MKVKIKNLQPNPYRDMKNYPINKEKVDSLKQSIEKTGFWDNILARQVNTEIQIAYGHHRLEALKQVMQPDDEVDIPVKELSDALMIKIMANENMEDWKVTPAVIDETVRVAKEFLDNHKEERELVSRGRPNQPTGAPMISDFLNWPESRVSYSLDRLRLFENNTLDKVATHTLPTERAARDFVAAVKKMDLPIEKQKQPVEKILETTRGERAVMDAVIEEKWESPKKKIPEWKDPRIINYEKYITDLRYEIDSLEQSILSFKALEKEIGVVDSIQRMQLHQSLNRLKSNIEVLLNNYENEKNTAKKTDFISIGK